MSEDLKNWQAAPAARAQSAGGPLCPAGAAERRKARRRPLRGLDASPTPTSASAGCPTVPPKDRAAFQPWLDKVEASEDPLFFTVIDKASGKIAGRQTLMRIDPANGVIEIGNIYWGPLMSRKPAATEAQFLFMQYIFDELGYRRYEWKCNNRNEPSKRAARAFRLQVRGHFPPAHGRQGRKPRHRVVFDHRQGMAGPEARPMRHGSIRPISMATASRSGGSRISGPSSARNRPAECSIVTTITIDGHGARSRRRMATAGTATVMRMARPTRSAC